MDNRRNGQYWAHKTQDEDKQRRKHTPKTRGGGTQVGGLRWAQFLALLIDRTCAIFDK